MIGSSNSTEFTYTNAEPFLHELKLFVNQMLFDKNIITEDIYLTAKSILSKQTSYAKSSKGAPI